MTEQDLLEPVAGDPPCGPDLERADDPGFLDYYYEAESRLPERYVIPGSSQDGREDRVFDPRSVDLAGETRAIRALLARSRDLRLVSLLARFQILAGRLADFAASVEAMAGMLEQWPDAVHPQRDTGERRGAIESLNAQTAVVMALVHLPLLPNADVTLRRHLVAAGRAAPRLSEEDLPGQDVTEPLRTEANGRHVAAIHASLTRTAAALSRLQGQAAASGQTPDLGAVRGAVGDMLAMIAASRPDLPVWTPAAAPDPAPAPAPEADMADMADAAWDEPDPTDHGSAVRPVPDRAHAAAALDAVQAWLARHQPSSPALILATQARQLVGVPLVQAIEMLMPDRAAAAVLTVGKASGFRLPMDRLRDLTAAGLEGAADGARPADPPPPIGSRADLIAQILGIEGYFTAREPASPIPLLLSRARTMLDQRFDAIVAELLVPPGGDS